jgi:hypothetical protein
MLPMSIEWEVANSVESSHQRAIVDGSSIRGQQGEGTLHTLFFDDELSGRRPALQSGECTEVFACDYESQLLEIRFKETHGQNWSHWAPLSLEETVDRHGVIEDESDDAFTGMLPSARQINVQVTNDSFGVPLSLGVRIVPKTTLPLIDDPSSGRVYGLEVIVYAELWIKNITNLPLNFGCPSYQLHESGYGSSDLHDTTDESAARFTAESALMEIANLLEVGDKGTGLSKKAAREVSETGGIESLPNQECSELMEEVFEYIEIDASTIKRRWWASESYDSYREKIIEPTERHKAWSWIDEGWVRLMCSD